MAGPDELLPRKVWLLALLPPPRFPAASADEAFVPTEVDGSRLDVAEEVFGKFAEWGYGPIGQHVDAENAIEVVGWSSDSAAIWVVFMRGSLSVLITPGRERDASRLSHHLAAPRAWDRVAVWGTFPLQVQHLSAAGRTFLAASEAFLRGGQPDLPVLRQALDVAAERFANDVSMRSSWKAAQGMAAAGKHKAAVRALAYWEPLAPEQEAFLAAERLAAASEPPLLERDGRSDMNWFVARADLINSVNRKLMAAFERRDSSEAARADWSDAAADFHDALDLLYHDLEDSLTRARQGDADATAYLVTFLEADPWCFRSGYMKGRIYERLRQVALDEALQIRLRAALLNPVDAGGRREFRSACRLARKVWDDDFVSELHKRLQQRGDPRLRRRALWMLSYLPDGLRNRGDVVLEVLLDTADSENWWRVSRWAWEFAKRYSTPNFEAKIRSLALSADVTEARRALRLLPLVLRTPLDAGERYALEQVILDAVQERGPGVGLMESLSRIADTKRLRQRLAAITETSPSPANRYAQWALNAALRANGEEAPDL